jgi:hypothetical protein
MTPCGSCFSRFFVPVLLCVTCPPNADTALARLRPCARAPSPQLSPTCAGEFPTFAPMCCHGLRVVALLSRITSVWVRSVGGAAALGIAINSIQVRYGGEYGTLANKVRYQLVSIKWVRLLLRFHVRLLHASVLIYSRPRCPVAPVVRVVLTNMHDQTHGSVVHLGGDGLDRLQRPAATRAWRRNLDEGPLKALGWSEKGSGKGR